MSFPTQYRVLQYDPGFAGRIVNACAVLHNIRLAHGILYADALDEFHDERICENNNNAHDIIEDHNVRGPLAIARRIQDRLIEERFHIN